MADQDFHPQLLSELLLNEGEEVASRAARRLLTEHPDLALRYQPHPAIKWRAHLVSAVRELAAAAELELPAIFHRQLAWMTDAFASRGVPITDMDAAANALRTEVLRSVPEADRAWVSGTFASYQRPVAMAEHTHLEGRDECSRLAARVLVASLEGERLEACALVVNAVRAGMSVRTAHEEVICPALREVGRLWHRGELSIPEEHACTSTMQTALAQILAFAKPAPRNGKSVLAASVEGNSHDIGLRMVADAFELEGYRTVNLGPNVPCEDLISAVVDFRADVVALSATLAVQLRPLANAVESLRCLGESAPTVLVGGPALSIAPDLWKKIGAHGSVTSAWGAVALADELLKGR